MHIPIPNGMGAGSQKIPDRIEQRLQSFPQRQSEEKSGAQNVNKQINIL